MHCIQVNKENFALSAFHDVTDRLKAGHAVVIFPEGEVNTKSDNSLLAFKSGAVLMAHSSGAPILPIYIAEKPTKLSRARVVVGEELDVCSMLGAAPSMEDMNKVTELLRERELALREFCENGFKL